MERLNAQVVAQRLREVVADEPKAFAYEIGVSLSAIYNYMNGRIPSTEVLYRIARYTGRPMEWFLGAEEPALFVNESLSRPDRSALNSAA